jgi:hypothetical protein
MTAHIHSVLRVSTGAHEDVGWRPGAVRELRHVADGGSMFGADVTPILRIDPHSGLTIDVETWAQAHGYHQRHQRLHALYWHGVGVARGLTVVANVSPDNTVVVEPGVAIDGSGHVILVPDYERVALPSDGTVAYVKLEYIERPDTAASPGRVVEDFRIRATSTAPGRGELELARIEGGSDGSSSVRPASNWWAPADHEIDLRFGRVAVPGAARALTVAYLGIGGDEPFQGHLEGFFYLVRAMRRAGIDVQPLVASAADVPAADLYYVAVSPGGIPSPTDTTKVHDAVVAGARLLVDGCSADDRAVDAIRAALPKPDSVSEDLGRELLRAHHVFAVPPLGSEPDGEFVWDAAGILTGRNYGCAWAGDATDNATASDALEFGVNVAVWASSPAELLGLDRPPR